MLAALALVLGFGDSLAPDLHAQRTRRARQAQSATGAASAKTGFAVDTAAYGMLRWRNVGPFRGGRAGTVAGVADEPNLFYMGTAGGGVWRTTDGGRHWEPISDGYFGGTVGAVAVAPSDANVIYAGGGEQTLRGNVSYGYGLWRSTDAGKTWTSLGLDDARHVGRIRVHPRDADVAYVAVMGDLYTSSETRGVYRTTDGGATWQRVLSANADAGAVDVDFDAHNPRTLFASTWRVRRSPHDFSSGGEGSDLWRSTDAGDTWRCLTCEDRDPAAGLPTGTRGIIGVASSPAQRDRVWAIIEHAEKGGLYRSDDGGDTWQLLNQDRNLRQRAWYYSRVTAHPTDADQVYVMNVSYWHSKDGGTTFNRRGAPHGDHHDLWINPREPRIMAIADDGGAQVSTDGGATWTTYHNQPTAQFYRVTTDDAFPYRIYAAQQDNSTVRIRHRTGGRSIGERDWEPTAGCECGHLAPKPDDPEIVYGGCYDGFLERVDHRTGLSRVVSVYPDNPMGHGVEGMRYRFQWNFPIFFSPHDPDRLYTASQHLHVSTDGGHSWDVISPDLTRNDSTRMGPSGGPITKDNTSVEYYCTVFAAAESPRVEGVLWAGSDDGLVHVTRDGGATWTDVTPPTLPEWSLVNSLEVSPHEDGGCTIAATRYKLGDYAPYLFRTDDYGATWRRVDRGIPRDHFTRVVRHDPDDPRLAYAGTESGLYVSLDGMASWQPLQLNLPVTPITDLALKRGDVIAATQGRALWVLDDAAAVLHGLTGGTGMPARLGVYGVGEQRAAALYPVADAYLTAGGQWDGAAAAAEGTNHPGGALVRFVLPDSFDVARDTVRLAFRTAAQVAQRPTLAAAGQPVPAVRTFTNHPDEDADEEELTVRPGGNAFAWNLRGRDAEDFDGMVLWWADMRGPRVPPGDYEAELSVRPAGRPGVEGRGELRVPFALLVDPRAPGGAEALAERYRFHEEVVAKVSEAHEAIAEMRSLREQVGAYLGRVDTADAKTTPLRALGERMDSTITAVERALYQTQNRSGQDPLNFPIRLTNKLASLNSMTQGEYRPTEAAYAVQRDIAGRIDAELARYYAVRDADVARFNALVRELEVPALQVE